MGLVVGGKEAEYGHLKNSILNFPSVAEWTAMMDDAGERGPPFRCYPLLS